MAEFKIDPSYKEVAERLRDLFAAYPEASMRGTYELLTVGSQAYFAYTAECYRHPDDQAPGIGTALEEVPGKTPYTRGSELQNAETSAWGRAIVAVGASVSKRIASADEMRLANDRRSAPPEPVHVPASPDRIAKCKALIEAADLAAWVKAQNYRWPWSYEACNYIELYAKNQPGPNPSPGTNVEHSAGDDAAGGEGLASPAAGSDVMTRAESKVREVLSGDDLGLYPDEEQF